MGKGYSVESKSSKAKEDSGSNLSGSTNSETGMFSIAMKCNDFIIANFDNTE